MRNILAAGAISLALLAPSTPAIQGPTQGASTQGLGTFLCRAFPNFCG